MAISKESKQAIRVEIEKLDQARVILLDQIKKLNDQRDKLIARRDDIISSIDKLKTDIANG